MSQKSITSFFTKKTTDGDNENLNRNNKRKLSSSEEEVKSKTTPTNKIKEKKNVKRIRPSKSPAIKTKNESSKLGKLNKIDSPSSPSKSDVENKDVNKSKPITKPKWNSIIDTDSSGDDEVKTVIKKSEQPVEEKIEESEKNGLTSDNSDSKDAEKKSPKTKKLSPTNDKQKSKIEKVSPKQKKSPKVKKETKTPESSKKPSHSFFGAKKSETSPEAESKPTNSDAKTISLKKAGEGDKGALYNPTPVASKYNPVEDASWKEDNKVPYLALAKTLESIEATSSRLKMIEILGNFLRSVIVLTPDDLLPCVYLCLNQLAPAYEGMELGIAETTLMKAIAQSTGRTLKDIKSDCQKVGDLAIVAEQSRSNQRMMFTPAPLTVRGVFEKLKEIAQMSGATSMAKKADKIQSLFVACRYSEARYLTRSLAGNNLRVGLAEQSVLQAIAQACTLTPPNQERPCTTLNALKKLSSDSIKSKIEEQATILKTAYCECPCYDRIIPVLLVDGIKGLPEKCRLEPGTPLKPMLAHPTTGISEVLTRFDGIKFTCEWKYDGERAQIHINKNSTVNIYSRNQENNTTKYPDILGRISGTKTESVESAILDCEAVAWDKENNSILPFQILSTRKRKDANEADIKVQVCVFMFDLLYLNGEPLVREPFSKRRELLHKHFQEVPGEWQYATSLDTNKLEELQIFLEDAIKGNCEGLMVKTLDEEATYEIAKRSRNWLKLKKDYLTGCGDTLDVVAIGGYLGRGKRTGVYGGFLLACYDAENEEYQSICKIGTGFSDADLQQHSEFFKTHIIPTPKSYYRYDTQHEPDHWFDAAQVWEIKCADLSLSPAHRAAIGIVDPEKGISLRFPRFIRIREDKNVEDATTAQQVADMYNSQDQIKNSTTTKAAANEDFF